MKIKIASTKSDISKCYAVLSELRPQLFKENFLKTFHRLNQQNNYQLVYLDVSGVKAVAGFRIGEWLHSGSYLEIEELITSKTERSKGYGSLLFDWLLEYASKNKCKQLRLVSGVNRELAHSFYLKKGMKYEAKYFSIDL